MKSVALSLLAYLLTLATTPLAAKVEQHGEGPLSTLIYRDLVLDHLKIEGGVRLEGTKVFGKVEGKGRLTLYNATVGQVDLKGPLVVTGSEVKGDLHLEGLLLGSNSLFNGEILAYSSDLLLSTCVTGGITIPRVLPIESSQILTLCDFTVVRGNIIFESGRGEIVLDKTSRILGQVRGATVKGSRRD